MNKNQERKVTRAFVLAMNTPAARETKVKRLSFRATFAMMVMLMFGGLVGLSVLMASTASADEPTNTSVSETDTTSSEEEPPSCEGMNVGEGTGECADVVESESHSRSSSQSRAVSVNGVSINSRVTVLARIRANGTPPSQQTNCFRTNRPMSLWTSYNAEGTTGWHWKSYPRGKRFCRINGAVRDPVCHNKVKIGVPKSKPPKNAIRGEVKFVKRLRWHVKAVAKADEKVTSHAKAWCTTQSAYAYGEGRGSASAYAVGRASARGSVLVKLHARVRAMAQGDLSAQLGGKSVIKVKAEVRATAFASATSEAHAKAVCKDTPPANQRPTGEIVQWPAHLEPGEYYRVKVVGSDPEDGGAVELIYSVSGGASIVVSDPNHPTICDVEGASKMCTFWIRANASVGVEYEINLQVRDGDGNLSPLYTKTGMVQNMPV